MRLIENDMDPQWRPGTRHQLPDALSRLPCSESPGEDINDAFPEDASSRQMHRDQKSQHRTVFPSRSLVRTRWMSLQ